MTDGGEGYLDYGQPAVTLPLADYVQILHELAALLEPARALGTGAPASHGRGSTAAPPRG